MIIFVCCVFFNLIYRLTHDPAKILLYGYSCGTDIVKNIAAINCAAPHITYTVHHNTCRAVQNLPHLRHITPYKNIKGYYHFHRTKSKIYIINIFVIISWTEIYTVIKLE